MGLARLGAVAGWVQMLDPVCVLIHNVLLPEPRHLAHAIRLDARTLVARIHLGRGVPIHTLVYQPLTRLTAFLLCLD